MYLPSCWESSNPLVWLLPQVLDQVKWHERRQIWIYGLHHLIIHCLLPHSNFLHGGVQDPLNPASVRRPNIMYCQEDCAVPQLVQVSLERASMVALICALLTWIYTQDHTALSQPHGEIDLPPPSQCFSTNNSSQLRVVTAFLDRLKLLQTPD